MFENLRKLDVSGKTSWMDLPQIGPGARVELAPAAESNKPFFNAILRRQGKKKARPRNHQVTVADLDESRNEDRELYAQYIIKNWECIPGPEGVVAYKPELALEFLECLPDWLFDLIRIHANDVLNYVPVVDVPPDAEDLAGNSESGSGSS